ncbi:MULTISPECIES: hypothetical protein [Paenibacillus]|uniref:hypothetical protein n=1 Tax=Paenibacillus TaxID=44249 RepID=UPI00203E291B|nr:MULTISPECIES: hypothetical protein [Paenibacillus]
MLNTSNRDDIVKQKDKLLTLNISDTSGRIARSRKTFAVRNGTFASNTDTRSLLI